MNFAAYSRERANPKNKSTGDVGNLDPRLYGDERAGVTRELSRAADEILLPFANPLRGALHLRLEYFVGDAAQEFQGGDHCRAPRRDPFINHGGSLSLGSAAGSDRSHRIAFSI